MEATKSNKRRSSIFQKRLSLYSVESSGNEEDKSSEEEEALKLTSQINKLKSEKRDWKNLKERLEKENSELKKKSPDVMDHTAGRDVLTPEDKQFLQGQVDYVSLGRLLDSTAEAVAFRLSRTNAIKAKLISLVQDCHQANADLTDAIIYRSIHHFDELDLILDDDSLYNDCIINDLS